MKMKLLVLALMLASLTAVQASAQSFNLGLEAGANFSNFIGSAVTEFSNVNDSKLGFVGGGFLSLNFGNSFAIRPEVLYEQKGNAISGTSTTTELDYIEVPVLLKVGLGSPVFNPSILLGPSFSWNLLAKDSLGNTSNINNSDIGVVGGVEIDIDKFLVSGRYELGLEDIQKNVNVQNGTITLLVGYSFM
ncbi:MAG TPA: porin family protein [bacterium]|jgi:hypothetical protein|nr:porin family protein [bacterium]